MPDAKPQPAPSMEEILASIKGLMADDRRPFGAPPRPLAEPLPAVPLKAVATEPAVLDLTEAIEPDGSVRHLTPPGAAPAADPAPERLVSTAASAATAAAFARLATAPRGELPASGGGRTLDELVREALRPLLREWLDAHLPGLVERLVREEIARLAGDPDRR